MRCWIDHTKFVLILIVFPFLDRPHFQLTLKNLINEIKCPGNRPLKWKKNLFFHTFDNIVFMPFENVCSTANKNVKFAGYHPLFLALNLSALNRQRVEETGFGGQKNSSTLCLRANSLHIHLSVFKPFIIIISGDWLTFFGFNWTNSRQDLVRNLYKL